MSRDQKSLTWNLYPKNGIWYISPRNQALARYCRYGCIALWGDVVIAMCLPNLRFLPTDRHLLLLDSFATSKDVSWASCVVVCNYIHDLTRSYRSSRLYTTFVQCAVMNMQTYGGSRESSWVATEEWIIIKREKGSWDGSTALSTSELLSIAS